MTDPATPRPTRQAGNGNPQGRLSGRILTSPTSSQTGTVVLRQSTAQDRSQSARRSRRGARQRKIEDPRQQGLPDNHGYPAISPTMTGCHPRKHRAAAAARFLVIRQPRARRRTYQLTVGIPYQLTGCHAHRSHPGGLATVKVTRSCGASSKALLARGDRAGGSQGRSVIRPRPLLGRCWLYRRSRASADLTIRAAAQHHGL